MADEVKIKESDKALIDFEDLNVKVGKVENIMPRPRKYARLSVYGKKGTGDADGIEVTNSTISTHKAKVTNGDELNLAPGSTIKLWNKDSPTEADFVKMRQYSSTLVVLGGGVSTIVGKIANSATLQSPDFYIWLTENASTLTLHKHATSPTIGVMLDVEKKGHLLYALTTLLSNPRVLENTAQIISKSFQGIVEEEDAQKLDDLSVSYFFKSTERTYLRGFWLGGKQARRVYADMSIKYDVKQVLGSLITKGMPYRRTTVNEIRALLVSVISANPYVVDLKGVFIPQQPDSNIVRGIIDRVSIKYEAENEVREIHIKMESIL